jgi:hypothetical protein
MAQLSMVQVAEKAWAAGFRGPELSRAVAVSYAESSGNTDVENYCCVGLMAINVNVHKQWTREQMKNPDANMQAAYTLWKESGWQPWDSSRGRQLLWRLPAENAASIFMASNPKNIAPNVAGTAADSLLPGRGAPDALTSLANLGQFFTSGRNWGRIGEVVLGGVLLVIALSILAKPVAAPVIKIAKTGAKL